MKFVLSLLLLTLSCVSASAETPRIDRIEIVDYGVYSAHIDRQAAAPGTMAGEMNLLNNVEHAVTTRMITAQLGVHFGFRYTVVGGPEGTAVSLHHVTIIPNPGLNNPANHRRKTRNEYDLTSLIGEQSYTDYSFDNDWEIVPGIWTFQIWYGDRMLAEQKFTIVRRRGG